MWGLSRSERRLRELEEQMLKLTRIVESHDLEWDDMRARCKRLLDRTEKAAKRVETGVESESDALTQEGTGVNLGNGRTLTPAQALLNQKILSRRRLTS